MFCQKCGHSLEENTAFCPNCGTAQAQKNPEPSGSYAQPQQTPPTQPGGYYSQPQQTPPAQPGYYNPPQPTPPVQPGGYYGQPQPSYNGLSIAGMIVGIASLLFFCFPLLPLVGLGLSIGGLYQVSQNPAQRGKGMAIAGLVCSCLGLLFFAVALSVDYWSILRLFGRL